MNQKSVMLSVETDDLDLLARIAERFASTAAGIAAEGAKCFLIIGDAEDEIDS